MEEYITGTKTNKTEVYEEIFPQIRHLIADEPDVIANLANISSVLKLAFPTISWVGFYLVKGNELVLGPFQGKPACVRIQFGKGVCGTSALRRETVIVSNVHEFPGHIFCDPESKSEIVVPMIKQNRVFGVLDVDSASLNSFDDVDKNYLELIVSELLSKM